jgi:hypothetical protein
VFYENFTYLITACAAIGTVKGEMPGRNKIFLDDVMTVVLNLVMQINASFSLTASHSGGDGKSLLWLALKYQRVLLASLVHCEVWQKALRVEFISARPGSTSGSRLDPPLAAVAQQATSQYQRRSSPPDFLNRI